MDFKAKDQQSYCNQSIHNHSRQCSPASPLLTHGVRRFSSMGWGYTSHQVQPPLRPLLTAHQQHTHLSPVLATTNVSEHCQMSPGSKITLVENHCSRNISKWWFLNSYLHGRSSGITDEPITSALYTGNLQSSPRTTTSSYISCYRILLKD